VIGVGSPRPKLPIDWFDVLVTSEPAPPRPWVSADVRDIADAVNASSTAAVTLAQVLRIGEPVAVQHAILLESLAYGLLQVGPRFQSWLQERGARRHHDADDPAVLVDRDGDVVRLTLNRPEVRNAYDSAMRDALVEGLQLVLADPSVTRVELHGAGPSFCSGGDLSEFGTTPDATVGHLVRSTRGAAALLAALAPRVHAFVQGACVGAGTELPAFAGTVHARRDATFALPEVRMGLVPGAGGTASVPRRIGRHRAAWLAITGATIDAATALAWGLVDEVDGTGAR
jgi:enoyl-CoA hydratase/carnithine racemase